LIDCAAGLKSISLTDVVLPTTGPTAGIIDDTTADDDGVCDEAAEAEMGDDDITDDESDDEEMDADVTESGHVRTLSTAYCCLHTNSYAKYFI